MFITLRRREERIKFGDIVKVKFDRNKCLSGMILYYNSLQNKKVGYTVWDKWCVKSKWFKFNIPKNLTTAHGLIVYYNIHTDYLVVYFPRLLKSGAGCALDIEMDQLENHVDLNEAKKLHKYVSELTRIYRDVDNFEIIETLVRHKHGSV